MPSRAKWSVLALTSNLSLRATRSGWRGLRERAFLVRTGASSRRWREVCCGGDSSRLELVCWLQAVLEVVTPVARLTNRSRGPATPVIKRWVGRG